MGECKRVFLCVSSWSVLLGDVLIHLLNPGVELLQVIWGLLVFVYAIKRSRYDWNEVDGIVIFRGEGELTFESESCVGGEVVVVEFGIDAWEKNVDKYFWCIRC